MTKRGWPDFFCWRGNKDGQVQFFVAEVKGRCKHGQGAMKKVPEKQIQIMKFLDQQGITVFVSDGETLYPFGEYMAERMGKGL